ncbi:MAG TPA: hypothetical protein VLI54_04950 [Bacillota bacterium]|nr:hypothetical protein [Bacillota bacterium]
MNSFQEHSNRNGPVDWIPDIGCSLHRTSIAAQSGSRPHPPRHPGRQPNFDGELKNGT